MPLNYSLGEEIDEAVLGLIRRTGYTRSPELVREIATTAFKLVEDGASRADLKLLNAAMKELRHSFRLFAPYRHLRKVSIFGSARLEADSPTYQLAEEFAGALVKAGFMVITGAGPGVMEAGNRGAGDGGSFGLGIRLPIEPEANPYIRRQDRLINFKYFFTRKLVFIKESDAVVLFPGGFGTMDECFELLTLLQTGKCDPRPVILMDPSGDGYWEDWSTFLRNRLAVRGLIDPLDLVFLTHVHETRRAVEEIQAFYGNYHSSRFVGEDLLVRLQREPSDSELKRWSRDFADMLTGGEIRRTGLPAEDLEDALLASLYGVRLSFDRHSTARLREFIDTVNGWTRA